AEELHVLDFDGVPPADLAADPRDHIRMARAVEPRARVLEIDPLERGREPVRIALAPDLAVGDDVEAGIFLGAYRGQRRCVLRGAVREAEEHRVLPSLVRHRLPRWDDENIPRAPRKGHAADLAAPVAFDRAVDRRVGGAVDLSLEPRWQPLNEGRDRRHRIP